MHTCAHTQPLSFSHFNTISEDEERPVCVLCCFVPISQFCHFWTKAQSKSILPHTLISPHCSAKVRALATHFTFSPLHSTAMANITPWGPETPAKSTSSWKGLMCPGEGTRDSRAPDPDVAMTHMTLGAAQWRPNRGRYFAESHLYLQPNLVSVLKALFFSAQTYGPRSASKYVGKTPLISGRLLAWTELKRSGHIYLSKSSS